MSTIVIPLAIAVAGKLLNESGKQPRTEAVTRQADQIPEDEIPSGTGMRPYEVKRYDTVDLNERQLAKNTFENSLDPKNSNTIPVFYNQFYTEQGDPRTLQQTPTNVKTTILPRQDYLTQEQRDISTQRVYGGPMFNSQLVESFGNGGGGGGDGDSDPIRIRKSLNDPNTNSGMVLNTGETSDLTGQPLNPTHNNMVPYFGSNVTQNLDSRVNEGTLERYTGTGEIANRPKLEVGPFFQLQRQNVYGTQATPEDLRKDRFVQSNLKTNLLPAPQIRVLPLSQAEEKFRPYTKNIDGLRAKTNPKITYQGRTQAPPQGPSQRGIQAPVFKNNPETTFFIGDSYRGALGSAEFKAAKADEDFITALRCTDRETPQDYIGHANPATRKAPKPSFRKQKVTKQFKNRTLKTQKGPLGSVSNIPLWD